MEDANSDSSVDLETRVPVSVGIMAYNEESLIHLALAGFADQQQGDIYIDEIIVVITGSIDKTESIVRAAAQNDDRIRIVLEPVRKGKIFSVINFLGQARNEICVISSADVIPGKNCLDKLAGPLIRDPNIGMTGPRITPQTLGQKPNFAERLHEELWQLHHLVALTRPKLGELVMVRHTFATDVRSVAGCDEVMLEASIAESGGELSYVPEALVSNFGATKLSDYLRVRRRNHSMHLVTQRELGYGPSTLPVRNLIRPILRDVVRRPRRIPYIITITVFEIAMRSAARWSFYRGSTMMTWEPSKSARVSS